MGKAFSVQFSIFAPPLREQLSGLRIPKKDVERFQRCADAVVQLYLTGVMTDSEMDRVRHRVMKKIVGAIPKRKRGSEGSASSREGGAVSGAFEVPEPKFQLGDEVTISVFRADAYKDGPQAQPGQIRQGIYLREQGKWWYRVQYITPSGRPMCLCRWEEQIQARSAPSPSEGEGPNPPPGPTP